MALSPEKCMQMHSELSRTFGRPQEKYFLFPGSSLSTAESSWHGVERLDIKQVLSQETHTPTNTLVSTREF